ncbi:uncharacterized protein [Amphiura filiformis]|uniref:uncharacterized protein n=1 Tax=Amphiura filiformis TaxID=82378 RepID=UPI003B20D333
MADATRTTNRVFLWTVGRSLSTVFTKCLSFVDGIQIINEPFHMALLCGPERLRDDGSRIQAIFDAMVARASAVSQGNGYDVNISTYDWAKKMLEADYPGKQIVFCKDFAFALRENYDWIPQGYRHTFLIRDPRKMFLSFKKLWAKLLQDNSFQYQELPPYINPPKHAFGELYELYQYVHDHGLEKDPIIIDADDLQKYPGSILLQYCKAVGIPYSENLLEWEAGTGVVDSWKLADVLEQANRLEEGGFYDAAFSSTHFLPLGDPPSRDEMDDDLLPLIDKSMVFYDKMYAARIKPE